MSTVDELLKSRGHKFTASGQDYLIHCLNPEHEDNNPSLRVDKDTGIMHCYGCGFKGNIYTYYNVFTSQIPRVLKGIKEKMLKIRADREGLPPLKGTVPYYKTYRDISPQTLKEFEAFTCTEASLEDRIVFPIKDVTGKTYVYQGRFMFSNAKPKYKFYPGGIDLGVYPPAAPPGYKSMVLVEGIFDMLNLWDKGLRNVTCVFGTNTFQKDTKLKLLPFKAQGIRKFFLLMDGDEAGEKAAQLLRPLVEAEGFDAEVIPMEYGKDPAELSFREVQMLIGYTDK